MNSKELIFVTLLHQASPNVLPCKEQYAYEFPMLWVCVSVCVCVCVCPFQLSNKYNSLHEIWYTRYVIASRPQNFDFQQSVKTT
jgi:hypothetical protein